MADQFRTGSGWECTHPGDDDEPVHGPDDRDECHAWDEWGDDD